MICVIKVNGKLRVEVVTGHNPLNCIGNLPDSTRPEDFQFVIETDEGVKICEKKKSAWLKEQIKNGN